MNARLRPLLRNRSAFTLIELLVVIAIIAVLAVVIFTGSNALRIRGQQTASMNNMRQINTSIQLYASDNDQRFPAHIQTGDKWPRILHGYLAETKVYADPGDRTNFIVRKADPLSNGANNTSYTMNGFNDVGAFHDESIAVRTSNLDDPSQTVLLAPAIGHGNFYMDLDGGNQNTVLNKTAFNGGSNYAFADGSVRFVSKKDYRDDLFLVHKVAQNN